MALTITKQPELITTVFNPIIYQITSSNYTQTNFRYIITISTDNGIIFKSKLYPRQDGSMLIDLNNILNNYIIDSVSDTLINSNIIQITNQMLKYYVLIEEKYSTSTTNTLLNHTKYCWNGSYDYEYVPYMKTINETRYFPSVLANVEQLTNPYFTSDLSGWIAPTMVWSAEKLVRNVGANTDFGQNIIVVAGSSYTYTIDVTTTGSFEIYLNGTTLSGFTGTNTYTGTIVAGSDSQNFTINLLDDVIYSFSTISLKLQATNATKNYSLSSELITKYVDRDDYDSLEFITEYFTTAPSASTIDNYRLRSYINNVLTATTTIDNPYLDTDNNPEYLISTIGSGPKNIQVYYLLNPTLFNTMNKYDITGMDINGTEVTQTYTYIINDKNPLNYPTKYRVAFLNKMGGFTWYTFRRNNYISKKINRNVYDKYINYDYTLGNVGFDIYNIKEEKSIILNTDFISESESNELENIFTSPKVYLYYYNELIGNYILNPVIVMDDEYTKKTQKNNKLINWSIEFMFCNKNNNQI